MTNSWIVAKFGGSSVKDASAMYRCIDIVKNNPEIKIVILSATYNTTNRLEEMASFASKGAILLARDVLAKIRNQHFTIANDVELAQEAVDALEELFEQTEFLLIDLFDRGECSLKKMDEIYSLGERMSSVIFSEMLESEFGENKKVHFLDSRRVIKTDSSFSKAIPNIERIQECADKELLPLCLDDDSLIVAQGFIGANSDGETTTLGREGSDFSGALFAEAIGAKLLQIWTDVPGVFSNDPKVDSTATVISQMSYDQAEEMARNGAKILFPETLMPVRRKTIPVFVGSSLDAKAGGTEIS